MSLSCLDPVRIRHGEDYIYVPCGHCRACSYNKQADWATRLSFEAKSYPKQSVLFLGLSYNDEHLPENQSLYKRDVQLFFKRLRKFIAPRKCRFFMAGEYGEKHNRPHYHVILFGVTRADLKLFSDFYSCKLKGTVAFSRLWCDREGSPIGRVTIQDINPVHFAYVAKYSTKKYHGQLGEAYEDYFGRIPEFIQMSRRPGIGRESCEERADRLRRDGAIWIKPGVYKALPRYFINILFPDKDDLGYKEWHEKRVQYALDRDLEWSKKNAHLDPFEARELKKLQILRKIESMERKKYGYVKKSFEDILAECLERSAFERFKSVFERMLHASDEGSV
ncbi:replication initiator protein [Dipodfec virus UOA04_Rod_1143]|nr:replication initiator protein [Dipodfec virus UOA04_Rod_1143]